jgi:hypothetical protein
MASSLLSPCRPRLLESEDGGILGAARTTSAFKRSGHLMRTTKPKEIEAVLRLDGPARFRHFVKRVVDEERAWGLWSDGWALMADDEGRSAFPLWPARAYAELCRAPEWRHFEPRFLSLEELMSELAPRWRAHGVLPAVFPTPAGRGVTISVDELCAALAEELRHYE